MNLRDAKSTIIVETNRDEVDDSLDNKLLETPFVVFQSTRKSGWSAKQFG